MAEDASTPRRQRVLSEAYDTAVLDLDGVVYVGPSAVARAPESLASARGRGMRLAFVTNNAARTPERVADHLAELGIDAAPADVVTSAQAAARVVSQKVDPGARVYLMGGSGLSTALAERGLVEVTDPATLPTDDVAAVVQGYGPQMPWRQVVTGAILVRSGLPWVASNTDLTIPTAAGVGPGNGTLVRLIAEYAGREPIVAGKPQPPLFEETLARVGGRRPLVIGDRLDTDIAGAHAVGWDSLLVLTGVSGLADLVAAPVEHRPTYVGRDLDALNRAIETFDGPGDWLAEVVDGRLEVHGAGSVEQWWYAVSRAAWAELDRAGRPVRTDGLRVPE